LVHTCPWSLLSSLMGWMLGESVVGRDHGAVTEQCPTISENCSLATVHQLVSANHTLTQHPAHET